MALVNPGPGYPPPSSYMFIDGANLAAVLRAFGRDFAGHEDVPLNWARLRGSHRKVYYYDAVPVQQRQEDDNSYTLRVAPKRTELASIERVSGFHVRAGDVRHRGRRGNEQKMVDVQLAVDALLMASRGLFRSATIITSDLDFKPLITALVDMGVDVTLLYAVGETNDELIASADEGIGLEPSVLLPWIDQERLPLHRPQFSHELRADIEGLVGDAVADWVDDNYGRCLILPHGPAWRLVTERDPLNPHTHSLRAQSDNPRMLRLWTSREFGITIPTW